MIDGGLPDKQIADLVANGPKCVYHVTRAKALPDIAASGGLLSPALRDVGVQHGWGRNDDLGAALVCCSLRPHWGILVNQFPHEESVILVLDAPAVARLPGALLSPYNSAQRGARPYLLAAGPAATIDECRADKGAAELLVPDAIPFGAVRYLVFCDREARSAWWPVTRAALSGQPRARDFESGSTATSTTSGSRQIWR